MTCFTPLNGWRKVGGGVTFSVREGYTDRPLSFKCGQCRGCRTDYAREWAIRCVHEAQMHDRNSFVTLTYADSKLPADWSLCPKDVTDFCKRLREKMGPFRYYYVGEYGPLSLRPHYHMCLFGHDFHGDRVLLKANPARLDEYLYTSPMLEETWGQGLVSSGALTYQSANYVARYVVKKATGNLSLSAYRRVELETGKVWQVLPEFARMSRRPGIGKTWYEKYKSDVFPGDEVVIKGKKFRPPRYYDRQLSEAELEEYKKRRRELQAKNDLSVERLRVLELIAEARERYYKRGE